VKVMDDFYVTTRVLCAGKAVVYEPQAIGSEETSLDAYGEFHRKVRISQANFNLLPRYIPLLNPLRPLVAYGFFSHKLLRWLAPLLLIVQFLANIELAFGSRFYGILLVAQVGFYAAAGLARLLGPEARRHKLLLIPFYFVSMNAALLMGLFRALAVRGGGGTWSRVERAATRPAEPVQAKVFSYPPVRAQAGDYPN
jgi:hypothetical protein